MQQNWYIFTNRHTHTFTGANFENVCLFCHLSLYPVHVSHLTKDNRRIMANVIVFEGVEFGSLGDHKRLMAVLAVFGSGRIGETLYFLAQIGTARSAIEGRMS